ncbi:hypothetical protein HGRIS_003871 [Hohenbuehelia grisea]|uniref:DNA2/NAM7 helicase-like C-terminal domain-containing protein n=1 Tax=Hohenbuehelia grisea TaxID=104357 RepID=A0ABR3JHX3_9AGAR
MTSTTHSPYITPDVFKSYSPTVNIFSDNIQDVTHGRVDTFLAAASNGIIGITASKVAKKYTVVAFSTEFEVMVIHFPPGSNWKRYNRGVGIISSAILLNMDYKKFAFHMDLTVAHLYIKNGLHITNGVDMLSTSTKPRHSVEAFLEALGGEAGLMKPAVLRLFKSLCGRHTPLDKLALQAWCANRAASQTDSFKGAPIINTIILPRQHREVIIQTIHDAQRLHLLKPQEVKNDVAAEFAVKKGNLSMSSERYGTRVRLSSGHQSMLVEVEHGGETRALTGRVSRVLGRASTIHLHESSGVIQSIKSVKTIGREAPTNAEARRTLLMVHALQRRITLMTSYFVQRIWFASNPSASILPPPSLTSELEVISPPRPLNASQHSAVADILDEAKKPITVIHGPPGTGKTTVIAAAVISKIRGTIKGGIWLSAQSNVAVKNVAEKLASSDFFDFKILVSKDFHFDWHEHLYERIEENVIRSDNFTDSGTDMERKLGGVRVILCTLSMFSHPRISCATRLLPVQTVIFDEASQIEVGDYFPVLAAHQSSLRKLVFIGDDKQLPPYGQEDLNDLRSIFEMEHLRKDAVFLDTQYRMPLIIGAFISRNVYDGKLKSQHPAGYSKCCSFIDVKRGKELRQGKSWKNLEEARVVINIAEKLHQQGQSWRIITPYDPQRSFIESQLKREGKIPWEDKCFNVDAFQGNEDDVIIVSIVRTEKIGFLREPRRLNVMLTRCKKRLIVCTSRSFICGEGSDTLVGKMAMEFGDCVWVSEHQAGLTF